MARSPKTKVEPEAVAEVTTAIEADAVAIEADAVAIEADGTDSDGTWPIEDESAPAAPQDQDTPPSRTEDSLDTAQAEDQAEVQPAAGGITVTITGPKHGRWRAGRHFSAEPTVIDIDTLTEDELAVLRDDSMLTIVVG
ncbi:hypothetical protein [Rhodobacter capsulatus]|uniref:hypothetical protein n=1 Tax=Rhodobacter capsulatus TaxID=1061 RepID=UPI004027E4E1